MVHPRILGRCVTANASVIICGTLVYVRSDKTSQIGDNIERVADQSAMADPEQIQTVLQLEQIFMPQAKKQRDAAYKRQAKPGDETAEEIRFVHYTAAEAALNIIKSKRLWMRNATCMADYREVQHGFDILNRFFGDPAKMESFIKAVHACVPGAAKEAIDLFDRWWRDIRFNTFITSVSEHYVSRGPISDRAKSVLTYVEKLSAVKESINETARLHERHRLGRRWVALYTGVEGTKSWREPAIQFGWLSNCGAQP
jgi:hypothetical protein